MKRQIILVIVSILCLNYARGGLPQIAETPPMGWNSWDCFGMDVTESQMKATADYMAKNLKNCGWVYIVLDMGWNYEDGLSTSNFRMIDPPQVMDSYGRLIPNINKFPSAAGGKGLKPLADYVHSLGLKFGIHIMRGIPWQAVEKNTIIKDTHNKARDIATEKEACEWFHGMLTVDMTKPGSQEYYNSLIEMYADWGIDYIKADNMLNNPYHNQEIEALQKAIQKAGRQIVLSLSAGPLPVETVGHLRKNANLWRISDDMWDNWSYIKETFAYCRDWQDYVIPNHWPDCDMLPLGKLRINGTDGALANTINKKPEETVNEFSRLTDNEKYTNVTLWSIFRSPLMIGGDLLQLDDLTKQLLTNEEVLAVNQKSSNNHELKASDGEIIWVADDPVTGSKYVAMFNVSENIMEKINIQWEELGISGKQEVRDIWKKENLGIFENEFGSTVPVHGVVLVKFTAITNAF